MEFVISKQKSFGSTTTRKSIKEQKTDWEVQLEEAAKRHDVEKQQIRKGNYIREVYLQPMFKAYEQRDWATIEVLFIRWGSEIGFLNIKMFNWAQVDLINFIKLATNTWLNLQPGCKQQGRATMKWKKTKLSFEKKKLKDPPKTTFAWIKNDSTGKFEKVAIKHELPEDEQQEIIVNRMLDSIID